MGEMILSSVLSEGVYDPIAQGDLLTGSNGVRLAKPSTDISDGKREAQVSSASVRSKPELVSAPTDRELYAYFGTQKRWVMIAMTFAFLVAALSLARFSLHSPWLWPMFAVFGVNILGTILTALTGWSRRRSDASTHRKFIAEWAAMNLVGPSIDVYLPTCGEDIEVLTNTYRHVLEMQWNGPMQIYVLDDGAREEVKTVARSFGFKYVVRPNLGHMKKAGNLQYTLGKSDGEFIVILDADFCPRSDFLHHLVPYMSDPAIGIVQSPQYFSTTAAMGWLERTAGATQEIFYRWVQPSRDSGGAPICVGTCALYRRAALDAAGGFAQIEHSEDVHTGIFLMRQGYVTRYVPIIVAKGLCPPDLGAFLNQQYRWCNGSITPLPHDVPNAQSLGLRQRLCFWAGFMYYISTAINVFMLYVPGIVMAVCYAAEVRSYQYVPFMAGVWVYFVLLPRTSTTRWRFEVIRTQMAYSFCHAVAIFDKLTGRSRAWVATGAVRKTSSIARSVSITGAVTLALTMGLMWGTWGYDVYIYGLHNFWTMGIFVAGYTYLSVPLLYGFLKVLGLARTKTPGRECANEVASELYHDDIELNRITMYEAVSYTVVIVFVAIMASGFFDIIIPWN